MDTIDTSEYKLLSDRELIITMIKSQADMQAKLNKVHRILLGNGEVDAINRSLVVRVLALERGAEIIKKAAWILAASLITGVVGYFLF